MAETVQPISGLVIQDLTERLIILGYYADAEALEKAHPSGTEGDCYKVGDNLYIWGGSAWVDIGRLKGEAGDPAVLTFATDEEVKTGTNTTKPVSPKGIKSAYLPLAGGTMTGSIVYAVGQDTGSLYSGEQMGIHVAKTGGQDYAGVYVVGPSKDDIGQRAYLLVAEGGQTKNSISVTKTQAMVLGKNIVRSVNGVNADNSGNVKLTFATKAELDAGTVTNKAIAPNVAKPAHDEIKNLITALTTRTTALETKTTSGTVNAATKATTATNATKATTATNATKATNADKWTTARTFTVQDATAAHSGTAVQVDGSAAVTLELPATIKATLEGNASTATKLGTTTVGSATQPIYLNAGAPTACTAAADYITAKQAGSTGYIKYASGLIIQWGNASMVNVSYIDIILPTPWTKAAYVAVAMDSNSNTNVTTSDTYSMLWAPKSSTDTKTTIRFAATKALASFKWLAIGI